MRLSKATPELAPTREHGCAVCGLARATQPVAIVPPTLVPWGRHDRFNRFWLCPPHRTAYACARLSAEERQMLEPWWLRATRSCHESIAAQAFLAFHLGTRDTVPPQVRQARRRTARRIYPPAIHGLIHRRPRSTVDNSNAAAWGHRAGHTVTPLTIYAIPPYPEEEA